jgi:hypothetical protein
MIEWELPRARKRVARELAQYGETPRVDLATLTYADDEVLGDWLP